MAASACCPRHLTQSLRHRPRPDPDQPDINLPLRILGGRLRLAANRPLLGPHPTLIALLVGPVPVNSEQAWVQQDLPATDGLEEIGERLLQPLMSPVVVALGILHALDLVRHKVVAESC
jgi:hypothetical protein